MKEIGKYINGRAFKPDDWQSHGIPIIRIENLNDPQSKFNYFNGECEKKYHIKKGDILLSWSATLDAFIWEREDAFLNQHIFKVVPDLDILNYDFSFHLMKYAIKTMGTQAHGSTMVHVTKPIFDNFKVKFPKHKNQQQCIATEIKNKLTAVERMRQSALKQKEAVEALQGALLREVFPYKEGDELPKGWKWEKIDNLAKVGKTRKKKIPTNLKDLTSFVPMDSVDDITGKITKTLYRPFDELGQSYTYFENGDIIFAKITPCMQNGKCAIVSEMKNDFGFGSSEYIVLTPVKTIYTKWVHYFLRTVEFRRAAEEHFTGSAGQQRVPTDFVKKFSIPVPEDDRLIEKLTDELDKKHEEYSHLLKQSSVQLEAIEALPAAILREVFEFKS